MKLLCIDETGDHSLAIIDRSYPIFVLVGIIVDQQYHDTVLSQMLDEVKQRHFGTTDIILHSQEMTHPQTAKNPAYLKFLDTDFRKSFYKSIEQMLQKAEISIVACVIMKDRHFANYGLGARDPYLLSFDNLINRLVFDLDHDEQGQIIAESRNGILDNQLEIAYLQNRVEGTSKVRAAELKLKLESSIQFKNKADNTAGIQLADIVASPIARYHLGKPERQGQQISYESVLSKVRNINGRWENIGISVIPKQK